MEGKKEKLNAESDLPTAPRQADYIHRYAQLYVHTPQTYTLLSAITDSMPARQPFCKTALECSIRVIVTYAAVSWHHGFVMG